MRTVLITGGFGYVGGRLARRLAREAKVVVSSRRVPSPQLLASHGHPAFVLHDALQEPGGFPAGVDTVIHLAALNERDCVKFPSEAIRVNIDGTRRLLDQAVAAGVSRFIYFSTAHVYGAPLVGVVAEDTLPVPSHPYAITHRAAEDYVVAAARSGQLDTTVLRLSNSFGAPVSPKVDRWTLLANDLCRQAAEKGRLALQSTGQQHRDFICLADVEEVVAAFVSGRVTPRHRTYNLGSGQSMRVLDMAHRISELAEELLGRCVPIELPAHANPEVAQNLQFSVDLLKAEGVRLKNDVDAELSDLIRFCVDHFAQVPE